LEIMGHEKGEYDIINPNDDVNKSQSTNDTYPAALKLTTKYSFGQLTNEIESLLDAFEELAVENKDIELMGMTQLRNAVKMSYFDLFHGYAASLKDALQNIENSLEAMNEIALGGTAIGTGIGAPKGFGEKAVEYLNSFTTFKFAYSTEAVSIISDPGDFATVSSALKQFAIRIGKITDDIRLLASSRFGNITIPAKQLGSSIMPGKINPVIPEAMNAVSMVVLGNDNMISNCLQSGQLQLNPFVPLIAHKLLDSSSCLKNAIALFEKECVRGIKVNAVPDFKNNDDTDYLTHLVDKIGYKAATQIRVEAEKKGVSPSQIAREKGLE
ncbi:MAG: aspartate ammonia-lyase, partial [Bifidobacteriaceae bacterium]|nr:aspartate ammonia-lyase [Bifidobacteriaceae bacterium]